MDSNRQKLLALQQLARKPNQPNQIDNQDQMEQLAPSLSFSSPSPPSPLFRQPQPPPSQVAQVTRSTVTNSRRQVQRQPAVSASQSTRSFGGRMDTVQSRFRPNVQTPVMPRRFRPRTTSYNAPIFTGFFVTTTMTTTTTPTIPKTALTVTSLVPVVKTFTLNHGFRTSEAVVTTSSFVSSIIRPDQYELTIHPSNSLITLTQLSRSTDVIEPTRVTHFIVTTASVNEIKLVPIKVGFSTKTNTVTSSFVLTTVTSIILSASGPVAPFSFVPMLTTAQPSFRLDTVTTTFVSTSTILSSSLASVVFKGHTFVSTSTATTFDETTLTRTLTHTVQIPAQPTPGLPSLPTQTAALAPSFLTTLVTIDITNGGHVTQFVTQVTVNVDSTKRAERAKRAATNLPRFEPTRVARSTLVTSVHSLSRTPSIAANQRPVQPDRPEVPTEATDKYSTTGSFSRRSLKQYGGSDLWLNLQPQNPGQDFFRDFTRLAPFQSFPTENVGAMNDFSDLADQGHGHPQQQPPQPPQAMNGPLGGQGQQFGSRPGTFQRIKLNGNNPFAMGSHIPSLNQAQPQPSMPQASGQLQPPSGFMSAGDNSPFSRFQRVVIAKPDSGRQPQPTGGNNFRRVPVFSNQLSPPLQPLSNPSVVVIDDSQGSGINNNGPADTLIGMTRPTQPGTNRPFRRVRPQAPQPPSSAPGNQGNNRQRVRPVIRVRDHVAPAGPPVNNDLPSPVRENFGPFTPFSPLITESSTSESSESTTSPAPPETTTPKRIIRIRTSRPPVSVQGSNNNGRRRVVLRTKPTSRPTTTVPVPVEEEPSRNNALDQVSPDEVNFGNRFNDDVTSNNKLVNHVSKVTPAQLEPSVPLTFFTTFTYLTTVIRGQHSLTTSREMVTSSVATQPLDSSLAHFVNNPVGLIQPTATRNLATRTRGPTTTIVNLASAVHVSRADNLAHIAPTRAQSAVPVINPTRKPVIEAPIEPDHHLNHHLNRDQSLNTIKLKEIDQFAKSLYTKYTYFYTIIDGTNTRKSTRTEVVSTAVTDPNFNLATIKIDPTINHEGFISLGSGPETVHLGKRTHGQSTTEVNLAMQTLVRLEGISNVVIETLPTQLPEPTTQSTPPLTDRPLIESSFVQPSAPLSSSSSTPDMPVESTRTAVRPRRPVRVSSVAAVRDPLRTRVNSNSFGRPQRVRVRPVTREPTTQPPVEISSTSEAPLPVEDIQPQLSPNREPVVVSSNAPKPQDQEDIKPEAPSVFTRTYYTTSTDLLTILHEGEPPVTTAYEETHSNVMTFTLPVSASSVFSPLDNVTPSSQLVNHMESMSSSSTSLQPETEATTKAAPTTQNNWFSGNRGPVTSPSTESTEATTESTPAETTTAKRVLRIRTSRPRTPTQSSNGQRRVVLWTRPTSRPTTMPAPTEPTLNETIPANSDGANNGNQFNSDVTRDHNGDQLSQGSPVQLDSVPLTLFTTFTYTTTIIRGQQTVTTSREVITSSVTTQPRPIIEPTQAQPAVTVIPTMDHAVTESAIDAEHHADQDQPEMPPREEIRTQSVSFSEAEQPNQDEVNGGTPSVFTRTYFTTSTDLITILDERGPPVTSAIEVTHSNVITFTLPGFSKPAPVSSATAIEPTSPIFIPFETKSSVSYGPDVELTTRTTQTTLTHLITLYSGSSTLLSTIEEVSPTFVVEPVTSSRVQATPVIENVVSSSVQTESSEDFITGFIPSVSTFYETNTLYTTVDGELASREEVSSSLVTLYVPQSYATLMTPTPSLEDDRVSSTPIFETPEVHSSHIEDMPSATPSEKPTAATDIVTPPPSTTVDDTPVILTPEQISISLAIDELKSKGLTEEEASVAFFGTSPVKSTQIHGDSTIVFFPDIIQPSLVEESAIKPTEGTTPPTIIQDGAVINLEDLLSSGKDISGVGAAIRDIVQLIGRNQGDGSGNPSAPVYVPPSSGPSSTTTEGSSSERQPEPVFKPDSLAPVFNPEHEVPSIDSSVGQYNTDGTTSSASTPSLPTAAISSSPVQQLNSNAIFSTVDGGATTIFFGEGESSNVSQDGSKEVSTKYVTSVESMTRTLTLTTTKVYYTRDSPLTITSVLTTVIPPKTFVSTIIGSRTILGTATEPTKSHDVEPSSTDGYEGSTRVTTTTLIFNSITTTVVRTLVIPSNGIQPTRPVLRIPVTQSPSNQRTRKPLTTVRKATTTTMPSVAISKNNGTTRKRPVYKPKPPQEPTIGLPTTGRGSNRGKPATDIETNKIKPPAVRVVPTPIIDDDQCTPACNLANKEVCIESSGIFKCDCRPGFARKEGSFECKEMQSYVLLIRLMKVGEENIVYKPDYSNRQSGEYKKLAQLTTDEVDKAYGMTDVKDNYISANVMAIGKNIDDDEGVLVNLTLKVTGEDAFSEEHLRDELVRSLEEAESLPSPAMITAEVEDVMDFDECSDPNLNDCSSASICINQIGSYTCKCKGFFADLDPSLPGRVCAAEVKQCDLCNGRGDCIRDETGDITSCKCQRMYLGRYCEINGILLATLLPVAAILSIISVCCIVYCCRKYKKRTNLSKGFRNMAAFGPNTINASTLDRKAMLETSSDNSDHYRSAGHVSYEGPGSMDPDSSGSTPRRRRGSEPSLDRGMGAGSAFTGMPPQVVIPRARHPNQFDDEPMQGVRRLSRPSSRQSQPGSRPDSRTGSVISDRGREIMLAPSALPMPEVNLFPEGNSRYRKGNGEKLIKPELRPSSRGSRMSYDNQGTHWPQDENGSVYSRNSRASRATSAAVGGPQRPRPKYMQRAPSKDQISSRGSKQGQWDWTRPDARQKSSERASERGSAYGASFFPGGAPEPVRGGRTLSEAGRSVDETIQYPPTRSYHRYSERGSEAGGAAPSVVSRGYSKGWKNMDRAAGGDRGDRESEHSYATSFLTTPNRYQFAEDRGSVANSRRSYFSNTNWGHLPFYED
ncbi:Transmembrane matrix receptor MUP-4 [Halotydeus destructor]|nr:Transmembrane matrix receptor MUP-4 [Halotydeus destructor]